MKKSILNFWLLLFLISMPYLLHSQNNVIEIDNKVVDQVDSIFQSMVKSAENLNYDELSIGVDDKYKAGFIVGDKYYSDYNSMLDYVKSRSNGLLSQKINIEYKKITPLSDKQALLTAYGIATAVIENGGEISAKFFWTFVYENIDGNWKVIFSHQSNSK